MCRGLYIHLLFIGMFLWIMPIAHADSWLTYKGYDKTGGATATNETHISSQELITWTHDRTIEALSFEPFIFQEQLNALRENFTDRGWHEYKSYMLSVKIPTLVTKKNLQLTTAASDNYRVVKEIEINGYRAWQMSVPLILSFFQAYTDESGGKKLEATGHIKLDVIVKRVDSGADENDIAIHSWSVATQPTP